MANGIAVKGCRVPLPQPPETLARPCATTSKLEFVDEAEVAPVARDLTSLNPPTLRGTTFELKVA